MTVHYLIVSADFEFVYQTPSGSAPSVDPAELDQLARTAVLATFRPSALAACNTGSVLRTGSTEQEAGNLALSFVAGELAAARQPGVTEMPELPYVSSVYWRPVGPLHQIIGKVEKVSGPNHPWWSYAISKGQTTVATAYLCVRMNVRPVS